MQGVYSRDRRHGVRADPVGRPLAHRTASRALGRLLVTRRHTPELRDYPGARMIDNRFPYNLAPTVQHRLVWFDPDVEVNTEKVKRAVESALPEHDVTIFENPPHRRSVPSVRHVHAFTRGDKRKRPRRWACLVGAAPSGRRRRRTAPAARPQPPARQRHAWQRRDQMRHPVVRLRSAMSTSRYSGTLRSRRSSRHTGVSSSRSVVNVAISIALFMEQVCSGNPDVHRAHHHDRGRAPAGRRDHRRSMAPVVNAHREQLCRFHRRQAPGGAGDDGAAVLRYLQGAWLLDGQTIRPEEALWMFVQTYNADGGAGSPTLACASATLGSLYAEYKSSDGFLYLSLALEITFGSNA